MSSPKTAVKVFDIAKVVKEWADRTYERDAVTRKQKNLMKKEQKFPNQYLSTSVDWSEVVFRDDTNWERLATDDFSEDTSDRSPTHQSPKANGDVKTPVNDVNSNGGVGHDVARGNTMIADGGAPHTNILFQTEFTNNTDGDQDYTMKTEKTTRSSCTIEVENCYTKGIEMSVTMKTPCEVFEASAGYKREQSLTNAYGETIEEELVWGVESKISVKPRHVAEAQLIVKEKKYTGKFEIQSQIHGRVYVHFYDIRDNSALVNTVSGDIGHIVQKYQEMESRKGNPHKFVNVEEGIVHVQNTGVCKFRYGVKQQVRVDQMPLK